MDLPQFMKNHHYALKQQFPLYQNEHLKPEHLSSIRRISKLTVQPLSCINYIRSKKQNPNYINDTVLQVQVFHKL